MDLYTDLSTLSTAFLTKMRDILWKLQEQTFCEVVTVSPTIFIKEDPKHAMIELLHKRLNCCKKQDKYGILTIQ